MAKTTEVAPNVYRISIYAQRGELQFNHFLVKDDEPLLLHTGLQGMHAEIREAMKAYQAGVLAEYVPYTPITAGNLKKLADLKPKTLAVMHGSSFTGDCTRALCDLGAMYREVFGWEKSLGAAR